MARNVESNLTVGNIQGLKYIFYIFDGCFRRERPLHQLNNFSLSMRRSYLGKLYKIFAHLDRDEVALATKYAFEIFRYFQHDLILRYAGMIVKDFLRY